MKVEDIKNKDITTTIKNNNDDLEEEISKLYYDLIYKIITLPDNLPGSVAINIIGLNNVLNYVIAKQKLDEEISEWNN